MITIKKAGKESRQRDAKRKRYLLSIGDYRFHITQKELEKISRMSNKLLGIS